MKDQVLSAEQMLELIDMGIDVSKASMCWRRSLNYVTDEWCIDGLIINNNFSHSLEYIPTFTLHDILSILPKFITKDNYFWCLQSDGIEYIQLQIGNKLEADLGIAMKYVFKGCYDYDDDPDILKCAFDMLKWCKENKYI